MSECVTPCCVLHNICKVHGEQLSEEWLKVVDSQGSSSSGIAAPFQPQDSAVSVRK